MGRLSLFALGAEHFSFPYPVWMAVFSGGGGELCRIGAAGASRCFLGVGERFSPCDVTHCVQCDAYALRVCVYCAIN